MAYYVATLVPAFGRARSDAINSNLSAIQAGFALLPTDTELKQNRSNYAIDTGAANAYVVTLNYAPTAYADGMEVVFKASAANTGASTINVNGLGPKNIIRNDGSALQAGDINGIVSLRYNATLGEFVTQNMVIGALLSSLMGQMNAASTAAALRLVIDAESATDLANASNYSKGVSLVAGAQRQVENVATIRLLPKTATTRVFAEGYYSAGDGGGGHYYLNASDTTSGALFTGSTAPLTYTPAAPTLGSSAGGTLGATTYYVKITYVTAAGESLPSAEASLAVLANNVLTVTSPAAQTGVTGYNVYVSTATGTETKQTLTPINIGTNWTEPTTGLITNATVPVANTQGSLLTVSAVTNGTLAINQALNRSDTGAGFGYVAGLVSGTGGIGTYNITGAVTIASMTMMADNGGTLIVASDGGRWNLVSTAGALSVKQFGAKGAKGGGGDDTLAIQNAINVFVNGTGGRLVIPEDFYLVSGTLNIGLPVVTNYTFITTRTSEMTDTLFNNNSISANITANQTKKHIELLFETGATLVANWTPSVDTPVLAYNLYQATSQGYGKIINPTIISSAMYVGGAYSYNAISTPQSNGLIGVFVARGCRILQNTFTAGIKHGAVSVQAYWTKITDMYVVYAGGRCLDIAEGNAMEVNNLEFWASNQGLVYDGSGASHITQIHTENVAQELTVFAADTTTFGPAYFEDVSTSDGTGTYSITLGYNGNGTVKLTNCTWNNLRVGSARPNKGGYRIWDVSGGVFNGCRAYSKTITTDIYSYITYNNCDFTPTTPYSRVMALNNGQTYWGSHSPPGSGYVVEGPWMFALNSIATGSIAAGSSANYTYTLPTNMNSVTNGTASATYTSGGNVMLGVTTRLLFNTPRQVQITFINTTAAAIDPGTFNMCLSVVAATP